MDNQYFNLVLRHLRRRGLEIRKRFLPVERRTSWVKMTEGTAFSKKTAGKNSNEVKILI